MDNAFAKSIDEVLGTLGVSKTTGLTNEQVTQSRAKHGKNGMRRLPSPRYPLLLFRG
jgi:Ca2+ transporting ATPase